MNKVQLSGRFTRDPEIRYTQNGATVASATIAVDRTVKRGNKWEREADFIRLVAFGRKAEFLEKYFRKGSFAIIAGNIKTGHYEKEDGTRVYTTDIWVEDVEFGGNKADNSNGDAADGNPAGNANDDFMSIPDGFEEELPFN